MEEKDFKGYQLLECFKDVILFQYNIVDDTIYFTSQISAYLDVKDNKIHNFVCHIDDIFPFLEDQKLIKSLKNQEIKEHFRMRIMSRNNQCIWFNVNCEYIYKDNECISVIGKMVDISHLQNEIDRLTIKAQRDGLTGVYNKLALEKMINQQLKKCHTGMVLMMDIDGFKKINDEYGHIYGDKVLRWVAQSIQRGFNDEDVLGRVGGDEFIGFVNGNNKEDLMKRLNFINHELLTGDLMISQLSMSIGIAIYPKDGNTYEELYDKADQAMYKAKKERNQKFYFYSKDFN